MERLLEENSDERAGSSSGSRSRILITSGVSTRVVLSGNSVENAVKAIACIHIGIGLVCLIGNAMLLFLLISYPPHDFKLIEDAVFNEDPNHIAFHLANLSKKQIVMMLTLTAMFFMLEIMLAKVLLVGACKRSRSRCQMWLDIHRVIWIIQLLSLVYNLFDFHDPTAATLVYVLWVSSSIYGISIYTVGKFLKNILNNQDFAFATCQVQKA